MWAFVTDLSVHMFNKYSLGNTVYVRLLFYVFDFL